jgi:hypothetical protein
MFVLGFNLELTEGSSCSVIFLSDPLSFGRVWRFQWVWESGGRQPDWEKDGTKSPQKKVMCLLGLFVYQSTGAAEFLTLKEILTLLRFENSRIPARYYCIGGRDPPRPLLTLPK